MAQTIKIKRSSSAASPSALENGELAYSSNSNYLYIGRPGGGTGDIDVIGGKAYIDMLEGTSAIPNNLIVENSATVGGHVELREATNNGANYVRLKSPNTLGANLTLTLPATVSDGQFLTTDASGNLSFAAIPSGSFTISDNQGTPNTDTFTTGQTLTFSGGTGITTTISDNDVDIANDGVLDITTSSGLSTNTNATGSVSITNTGVLDITTSSGLSTNTSATGSVSITNTGVTAFTSGTGLSTNTSATGAVSVTNTDRGSAQNIFKTFAVSGQSDVVADSNSDTLTLVQGGATTITTNATSDEITISSTDANVSEANLRTQLGNITENVTIGDATDVTVTAAGNLTVTGDLTVNGTQTILNTETLTVDDNIIVLNNNATGTPASNQDAGIEVERGDSSNVQILWDESAGRWSFTNNGTNYFNIPTSTEYDAYTSWTVGDGTNTEAVTSGFSLTFDANSFSYTAGTNTVAITTLDGGTYS
jgi:hypothetical protein